MADDALLGGEESGGYAFRGHIPERDGILSGLYLLEYMAIAGLSARPAWCGGCLTWWANIITSAGTLRSTRRNGQR